MYKPSTRLGERLVIARIADTHLPGKFTGETGQFDEHFEIRFDDILVEMYDIRQKERLHYEDLYESTDENSDKFLA